MTPLVRQRLARVALSTAVGMVALTALVGFAHTRAGRPLLAWLSAARGACPLGYDRPQTPADREAERRRFAATHAGQLTAASRPALGFELDRTTRLEVLRWAKAAGVTCLDGRRFDLDCRDVPATALPEPLRATGLASLWLSFGEGERLISVVAVRRDRGAEVISRGLRDAARNVSRRAGPATSLEGDGTPAALAGGLLRIASVEYRYADYYAVARAANLGDAFVLTEEYRSLAN